MILVPSSPVFLLSHIIIPTVKNRSGRKIVVKKLIDVTWLLAMVRPDASYFFTGIDTRTCVSTIWLTAFITSSVLLPDTLASMESVSIFSVVNQAICVFTSSERSSSTYTASTNGPFASSSSFSSVLASSISAFVYENSEDSSKLSTVSPSLKFSSIKIPCA